MAGTESASEARSMRIPLILVVAALLAAGCVGKTPDATETASRDGAPEPSVIVDPAEITGADTAALGTAPIWLPGDAWEITTTGDAPEDATLVVIAADSSSYTIATTSEDQASWDAILDVSYVGKIRAADLAGYQQDQPVQYFSFPLEDGKTWTANWDGLVITLTAKKSARGFDITGVTPEGVDYVHYDFVPELKWWSQLHFTEGYGFKVDRFVSGWQGELATATANTVFDMASSAPTTNAGVGTFTIGDGQSFAMVILTGGGAAWARAFQLVQPDGQPYLDNEDATTFESADINAAPYGYRYFQRLPALAGSWAIVAPTLHTVDGTATVVVQEILIEKSGFA